jgi:hypothetical protein
MLHNKRVFGVADMETIDQLAETLTEMDWTLCTGFRFRGLLFLNDSIRPDSAQEYAVIRESDMCQLESITFGWCDKAEAIFNIKACLAMTDDGFYGKLDPPVKVEDAKHHYCGHCA